MFLRSWLATVSNRIRNASTRRRLSRKYKGNRYAGPAGVMGSSSTTYARPSGDIREMLWHTFDAAPQFTKDSRRFQRQAWNTSDVAEMTEMLEDRTLLSATLWENVGPAPTQNAQLEPNTQPNRQINGAINTVLAHPSNADILYVGSVNGGIWKTTNATNANPTWVAQTDDQETLSIGAMAFDLADNTSGTLVAGTGRFSSFGGQGGEAIGVLRTTDGGATWTDPGNVGHPSNHIYGVAANGNTIVTAVSFNGIYRSTDAGATFGRITAGIPTSVTKGGFTVTPLFEDLVTDPTDPQRLYAVSGIAGVFRSDDFGENWTPISSQTINSEMDDLFRPFNLTNSEMAISQDGRLYVAQLNAAQPEAIWYTDNADVASPTWTRMDVPVLPVGSVAAAITAVTGDTVSPIEITAPAHGLEHGDFVFIEGVTGNTNANGQHYILVTGTNTFTLNNTTGNGVGSGGTWLQIAGSNPTAKDLTIPGSQGRQHFSLTVDPTNKEILYLGGDRQEQPSQIGDNTFGGATFRGDTRIARNPNAVPSPQWDHLSHDSVAFDTDGGTANGTATHADSREMVFDFAGNLIEVDDGGIFKRTSPQDNTGDWFSLVGNLSVVEFHDIAYDTVSNVIIGGTQDNGTHYQTVSGSLLWDFLSGGDGGDVAVDTITLAGSSQSIRYSSSQFLQGFRRTTWDASNNLVSTVFPALDPGSDPAFEGLFSTPLALNNIDPQQLLLGGQSSIYESPDMGDNASRIATGFTATNTTSGNAIDFGGKKDGVDNLGIAYVGDTNGKVQIRTTAGGAFTETSPGSSRIADVIMDSEDHDRAFAIDDNQVFLTTDAGVSGWSDITGNLMAAGASVFRSLEFIAGPLDAVVLGTNTGVFASLTTSLGTWFEVGSGLPNVPVYDLDYDPSDELLVAGTLGRGAWVIPDVQTLVGETTATTVTPVVADTELTLTLNGANAEITGNSSGTLLTTDVNGLSKLVINAPAGADNTLMIDFSNGNPIPAGGLDYDGGAGGNDALEFTGGTFTDAEFDFANENDGTIQLTGTGLITYTGLEPVTSTINATNVTLNFSETTETITVSDAGSGMTTVDSDVGGETTTFNNPTGTLTINAGDTGVNTINVTSLAAGFTANIDINGGSGGDTVNINGAISLASGKSLTVDGEAIVVGAAITSAGGGAVTLTANNGVTLSGAVNTGGGNFTVDADADNNGTGTLTLSAGTAGGISEQAHLVASDGASNDNFGETSDIDGDYAIIGAPETDNGGDNRGSAYIFVRSGGIWTEQQILTDTVPADGDQYGYSVAISGDTAVVGNRQDDDAAADAGSVLIYTRTGSTWTLQQKLTAGDATNGDRYGERVAIDGDTLLVGALDADGGATNSGAVYVYTRSGGTWSLEQKLNGIATNDDFGSAVTIEGDNAVIGAAAKDSNTGAAYVYTRSGTTWSLQDTLLDGTGAALHLFGNAVDISGDTVAVGSRGDKDNGDFSGSVFVYTRSGVTWSLQQQVISDDIAAQDQFGDSVALSGDTLLVGATSESSQGAAYTFTRSGTTWTQIEKLVGSEPTSNGRFGQSAAISGDTFLIGSRRGSPIGSGTNTGAASVFLNTSASTSGTVSTGVGDVSITAADVDLQNTITGTGSLTLTPSTATRTIGVGGGTGDFSLSDAELSNLVDGFSSITIGDTGSGTGTVTISTAVLTDPVTFAGGTINDGAGTDITAPSVTLDGTVAPGESAGTLVVDGDLKFATGETFQPELGGTTAGTQYDQLIVAGDSRNIELNDVRLDVSFINLFTPTVGSGTVFTIVDAVNNNSTLLGSFKVGGNTVNDGDEITVSGTELTINYLAGGDVTLTESGNTAPTVATNAGLTVNEGSAANVIAQANLEATDAEEAAAAITYTLDSVPANGTLWIDVDDDGTINNAEAALAASGTFTQTNINGPTTNRLKYNHDGSDTTSDSFQFDVSDGAASVNDQTFSITITPADTEITISSNVLTITDVNNSGDSNDQLTISYSGSTYTIVDAGGLVIDASSITGSATNGTASVTLPDTGVTGINFNVLGGDDSVTVNSIQASLSGDFTITGGTGTDTATINSGISSDNVTITAADIIISGGTVSTIRDQTYNGDVQLTADTTLNANDVTFNGTVDSESLPPVEEILIADTVQGKVFRYGLDGTLLGTFANVASAKGLAIDGDGNVYVSRVNNSSIEKFQGDGTPLGTFTTASNWAFDLAFDTSGILYASIFNNTEVERFDNMGNSLGDFTAGDPNQSTGLAFDSSGNLYVGNAGGQSVFKYDTAGNVISNPFASGISDATNFIAIDSSGNLLATSFLTDANPGTPTTGDGTQLQRFDSSGTPIANYLPVPPASNAGPSTGLAFDAAGNLYVGSNGTIQKITDAGLQSALVTSGLSTGNSTGDMIIRLVGAGGGSGPVALTINTTGSGTTTIGGEVGGTIVLKSLTTNADGRTDIGADINANGSTVTFNDDVLLTANTVITEAGSGDVTFNGDVDSEEGSNFNLTVDTAGGNTIFNGAIGGDAQGGGSDDDGLARTITVDNLQFNASGTAATVTLDLDGPAAGTQHDQFDVSGSVSLGSATLNINFGNTPAPGTEFVIIDNDGAADVVTGTFDSLTEGATVATNIGGSGLDAFITYIGGDGNDVVIVISEADPNLDLTGEVGDDNFTVQLVGGQIQVTDDGGNVLFSRPQDSIGGTLTLTGADNENDVFTVDFMGADLGINILVIGGDGTGTDSLVLANVPATFTTHTYNYTNANDGNIVLSGGVTRTLSYEGLEPVTNPGMPTTIIHNLPALNNTDVMLLNSGGAGDGAMQLTGSTFENVTFDVTNATTLTINGGGMRDNITVASVDSTLPANVSLTLNAGTNSMDSVSLNATSLSVGTLSVTGETINQSQPVTVTGTTTLASGSGDITLANAANDFQDVVNVTGDDVDLTDAGSIQLGTVSVGTLDVVAGGAGDITQDATSVTVTGAASFTASGDDITLTDADNDFQGSVTITNADNASLRDTNTLSIAIATLATNLTLQAGGAVTQAGEITGSGLELLGAGSFTLTNADNDFATIAASTTEQISYRDTDELSVGTVNTVGITTTDDDVQIETGTTLSIGAAVALAGGNLDLDAGQDILISNDVEVSTTGSGTIDADAVRRISITGAATFVQTVNGILTLEANAGGVSGDFHGLFVEDASITSTNGNISLTGTGGDGAGGSNAGVFLFEDVTVETAGTGAGAGTITIVGNAPGGNGGGTNGVAVRNNSVVRAVDGDISITGTALTDEGVAIVRGAAVTSTGTGADAADITILGTANDPARPGVILILDSAAVETVDGDISITGNGTAGGGVTIVDTGRVASTGTGAGAGTVTISGRGTTLDGVRIATNGQVASSAGAISITGTSTTSQDGVEIAAGSANPIVATNGATVAITGTGAAGEVAVQIDSPISSGTGTVTITANDGGSATDDITFGAAGDITSTSGTITIDADNADNTADVFMANGTIINAGTGLIDVDTDVDVTVTGLTTTGAVDVTAAAGDILDGGDTATDITGGAVTLSALNGAIGAAAAGDSIVLNSTSLTTTTATGNGLQFLAETGATTWNTSTAGTGVITLTAGRFNVGDTQTIAAFEVRVDDSAILGGDGNVAIATPPPPPVNELDVVVESGGSVTGGTTTPGILTTGNLKIQDGGDVTIKFNRTTRANTTVVGAPDSHDLINVTGTVTLSATATLTPTGTVAEGGQYVIIDNPGTDPAVNPVIGTIAGLAEGDQLPGGINFLGSNLPAFITYEGGDGNDVAITVGRIIVVGGVLLTNGTDDVDYVYVYGQGDTTVAIGNFGDGSTQVARFTAADINVSYDADLKGGNDTLYIGNGIDVLGDVFAPSGNNLINLNGTGDVSVLAGEGNDTIYTGTGNDEITVEGGNNSINITGGNNTVTTGVVSDGNDDIHAGGGNDVINTGNALADGSDRVYAGDGNNGIATGNGNDVVQSGTGDDTIITGDGNNSVQAGDGTNTITTGTGNDEVIGGIGVDTIIVGDGTNTVLDRGGNNSITTGDGNDFVQTSGLAAGTNNDIVNTGDGNDRIHIENGDNTVVTGNGDSYIKTGAGTDDIDVGSGNNTVFSGDGADRVEVIDPAGTGTNSFNGGAGDDVLIGSAGSDALHGGGGDDVLIGLGGNDFLYGGAGSNVVSGGTGDDLVSSSGGNSVLLGGAGADFITSGAGIDLLSAGTSDQDNDIPALTMAAFRAAAQAGTASITNAADDNAVDTLQSGIGADVLHAKNLVMGGDVLLEYAIDPLNPTKFLVILPDVLNEI